MNQTLGVLIAIVSSSLGGAAAAVTRYLAGGVDPITLAVLRWTIGFAIVLPVALLTKSKWPSRRDAPAVALLGICFYGIFFVLYNIALGYTTAARATLALSTLPLQTMLVGAILGIERLSLRKTLGVAIAMGGVFGALTAGLSSAPEGAWRGEAIMLGAVLCMAFYNVWSRQFIVRSSAMGFLCLGMGAGAGMLILVAGVTGRLGVLTAFSYAQWLAALYLGIGGGALAFILWVMALQRASPTLVANTMTVNPLAAALVATELVARAHHAQPRAGTRGGICRNLDRHRGRGGETICGTTAGVNAERVSLLARLRSAL